MLRVALLVLPLALSGCVAGGGRAVLGAREPAPTTQPAGAPQTQQTAVQQTGQVPVSAAVQTGDLTGMALTSQLPLEAVVTIAVVVVGLIVLVALLAFAMHLLSWWDKWWSHRREMRRINEVHAPLAAALDAANERLQHLCELLIPARTEPDKRTELDEALWQSRETIETREVT